MHVESTYLPKITCTSVATSMILGRLGCITITSTSLIFIKGKHVKWWVSTNSTGKIEYDSNTKILGLVDLRRFQGFELAMWPHERRGPWFASHRLLLDKVSNLKYFTNLHHCSPSMSSIHSILKWQWPRRLHPSLREESRATSLFELWTRFTTIHNLCWKQTIQGLVQKIFNAHDWQRDSNKQVCY